MGSILLGLLWGAVLYGLAATKSWLSDRSGSPDERIRFLARLNMWVLVVFIGLFAFDYVCSQGESPAVLLAMIGALGGIQLSAEIHWQLAVGRHVRRKKK